MSKGEKLNAAIDSIYEAMLEPTKWPVALSAVSDILRGRLPTLFSHDIRTQMGGLDVSVGYDPEIIGSYKNHFSSRNVWLSSGARYLRAQQIRTSHMMCSRTQLKRSEFYDGYCKPLQISQGIGATLFLSGSCTSNVAIFGGAEREDFQEADIQVLRALVPHLQRALQVHRKLAQATLHERGALQVLEDLPVGVILITRALKVALMNRAARSIVGLEDGIRASRHGLSAQNLEDDQTLSALLGSATNIQRDNARRPGGVMYARRPSGRKPFHVLVAPIHRSATSSFPDEVSATVVITESHAELQPALASVQIRYKLSAREAQILTMTVRGHTAVSLSVALQISYNTVKTHLRNIFAKTGTRSQRELATLVLSNAAGGTMPGVQSGERFE